MTMEKSLNTFTRRIVENIGRADAGAMKKKKRERHDNYQGFVPIVSAHSPPLTLEGPKLVARRRRLRRRAVRCSSSRLRFRQQQHELTTLVILRRGLLPKRDRSRGTLPVITAPGLIYHPASRRTTPKYLLLLLRLSASSGTKHHFSRKNKVTKMAKVGKKERKDDSEDCYGFSRLEVENEVEKWKEKEKKYI